MVNDLHPKRTSQKGYEFRSINSHKQQSVAKYVIVDVVPITNLYNIAINHRLGMTLSYSVFVVSFPYFLFPCRALD